jgi:hypothetical protein
VPPRLGNPDQGTVPIERPPIDVADSVIHLEAGAAGKVRMGADDASGGYPTVCQGGRHLDRAQAPRWVWLYMDRLGDTWAAMIVDDQAPALGPGHLVRLAFFGATPEEAEQAAEAYLGCAALGH